jgi:hypothetical protein
LETTSKLSATQNAKRRIAVPPRAGFWALALLLGAAHIGLVNYFMPIGSVLSNEPLHGIDYDLHIGQVFRVAESLDRWGKSWLYDVQLLAGQPEGTITDSGSKGWELWTFALCKMGVPRAIAFNSFVLLVMWSCPLLIFLSAHCFELSKLASLLAAAMASTLWFFDSHLHWVWFVGMISWCGASCLALLVLGLFQLWLRDRRPSHAVLTGGLLGLTLLVHPYAFFVLVLPMAATYTKTFARLRLIDHLTVLAMAVFTIAVNAYWLDNAIAHFHYILDSAVYAQASPKYLLCDLFDVLCSGSDTGLIGTRAGFRFLYLALAIAGLCMWRRERDARWLPVLCGILPLYGVAYFGGCLPGMQQTQPYRQVTPAMLFCTLPAAAFVTRIVASRALAESPRALRLATWAALFVLMQQLLASQVLYFFPGLIAEPEGHTDRTRSSVSEYGYPWRSNTPSQVLYRVPHSNVLEYGAGTVVRWLTTHVPRGARMLVEGSVLGERLAWHSGFEVLGGFFERNVQHVDANYFRAHRALAVNPPELAHYLQTFAVEWVVKDHPDFERLTDLLQRVAIVAGRHIYRTRFRVDRVLHGGGTVSATENRIEVRDSAGDEAMLLAYHWHEALRCTPNCRVERARIDIDRVGFIRVPAPHPADLVVWNGY